MCFNFCHYTWVTYSFAPPLPNPMLSPGFAASPGPHGGGVGHAEDGSGLLWRQRIQACLLDYWINWLVSFSVFGKIWLFFLRPPGVEFGIGGWFGAQFPYNCILKFRILDDWSNFFLKIVILNDLSIAFQSASWPESASKCLQIHFSKWFEHCISVS